HPLEAEEGVGAAVDLTDREVLGLGTLVLAAALEGGLAVVGVEELRHGRRRDVLELVAGVEDLLAVRRPDGQRATAEGVELLEAGPVVRQAAGDADVEPAEVLVAEEVRDGGVLTHSRRRRLVRVAEVLDPDRLDVV